MRPFAGKNAHELSLLNTTKRMMGHSLGTGTRQLSRVGAWIWVKFVRSQITKVDGIVNYFDIFEI